MVNRNEHLNTDCYQEIISTFHHSDVFNIYFCKKNKATVSGEIGDVISGKLAVPKGKTMIFKSLGKLELKNPANPGTFQ